MTVRRFASAVLVAAGLSCASAPPRPSPVSASAGPLRDKAVHALVHGRAADARRFATEAIAAQGGGADGQAHLVLAVLDWGDCSADAAAADLAAVSGVIPEDFPLADQVAAVRDGLRRFGRIELAPAPAGPARAPVRVRIDPTTPPLDPETRRCVEALRARLDAPLGLPASFLVPAGEYSVNGGRPFTVEPGGGVKVAADGRSPR